MGQFQAFAGAAEIDGVIAYYVSAAHSQNPYFTVTPLSHLAVAADNPAFFRA
jgi:hypothetical protein